MKATWYRIEKYSDEVEPVTVIKETEKMVQLESGCRRSKHSDYERYFTEEKEAWQELLKRYENQEKFFESKLLDARESKRKCQRFLRGLGDVIIE